jgi:stress responsive alpha/beta barrel protein
MILTRRRALSVICCAALFIAGVAAGSWHAPRVSAQNKFGQPKTVLHVVIYKWKAGVSEGDQQRTIDGIKTMAAKIPGIKNVWLKTERNQLRDFSGVYAIEFASPDAAADYAESKAHELWSKPWMELRETSLSFQVSNP